MRSFLLLLALALPVTAFAKLPPECKKITVLRDAEATKDIYKANGWLPALMGFGLTWRAELRNGAAKLILELPSEGIRKEVLEAWHPVDFNLMDGSSVQLKTWAETKATSAAEGSRIYTIWIVELPVDAELLPRLAQGITEIRTDLHGKNAYWPALKPSHLARTMQCFAALAPPA